jgi:hypothetical protein
VTLTFAHGDRGVALELRYDLGSKTFSSFDQYPTAVPDGERVYPLEHELVVALGNGEPVAIEYGCSEEQLVFADGMSLLLGGDRYYEIVAHNSSNGGEFFAKELQRALSSPGATLVFAEPLPESGDEPWLRPRQVEVTVHRDEDQVGLVAFLDENGAIKEVEVRRAPRQPAAQSYYRARGLRKALAGRSVTALEFAEVGTGESAEEALVFHLTSGGSYYLKMSDFAQLSTDCSC